MLKASVFIALRDCGESQGRIHAKNEFFNCAVPQTNHPDLVGGGEVWESLFRISATIWSRLRPLRC